MLKKIDHVCPRVKVGEPTPTTQGDGSGEQSICLHPLHQAMMVGGWLAAFLSGGSLSNFSQLNIHLYIDKVNHQVFAYKQENLDPRSQLLRAFSFISFDDKLGGIERNLEEICHLGTSLKAYQSFKMYVPFVAISQLKLVVDICH